MKIFDKIRDHAFVASVSIAAFTHSSWSLATVFGGHEPEFGWQWAGWIIPAALIAASIDIGLLSLASQIQNPKERNKGRIFSFALLALGMFALQGLYVSAHMPVIPLAAGVRSNWIEIASLFRDSMLFVVPGLLPLALVLHTISGSHKSEPEPAPKPEAVKPEPQPQTVPEPDQLPSPTEPEPPALPEVNALELPLLVSPNGHSHAANIVENR